MVALQPTEIGKFWDLIKVAMVRSSDLGIEVEEDFLNDTLERCMSGKLVCWMGFERNDKGEKEIYTVVMTSIVEDRLFGYRYVVVEGIFGLRKMSNEQAKKLVEDLGKYTKNVGAKYLKALTSNPKAMRVCEEGGAKNIGTVYSLEV